MIDIYRRQWHLGVQLCAWSVLSIALGAAVLSGAFSPVERYSFLSGLALQTVLWGGVDGVLALIAMRRARRRSRLAPDEYRAVRDTVRIAGLLRLNARLDVLYILTGGVLALAFRDMPFVRGNGVGVAIQGVFLFFFDLIHARRLPREAPPWYDPQA